MNPWSRGKYLVWDSTCMDTFCQSNIHHSSDFPGGAAAKAENSKATKYSHLDDVYLFQPIAMETTGTFGPDSLSFLKELGRRLRMATGEPQSGSFLIQRLSVAIQTGNSASVLGSLPTPQLDDPHGS